MFRRCVFDSGPHFNLCIFKNSFALSVAMTEVRVLRFHRFEFEENVSESWKVESSIEEIWLFSMFSSKIKMLFKYHISMIENKFFYILHTFTLSLSKRSMRDNHSMESKFGTDNYQADSLFKQCRKRNPKMMNRNHVSI